jgi:hypothetical protein
MEKMEIGAKLAKDIRDALGRGVLEVLVDPSDADTDTRQVSAIALMRVMARVTTSTP